jgi:hypothetical protein
LDVLTTRVPALAPEDLLPFLAVHGGKHLLERLNWVCDVAEMVRADRSLDWPALLAAARQTRQQRHLAVALLLASRLPSPADVAALRSPPVRAREGTGGT